MTPTPSTLTARQTPPWESLAGASCYASSCGRVTLYLGDCRDVLPMLQGVDAVVTDPPYGIGKDAATRRPTKWQRADGMPARDWDNEPANVS